MTKAYGFAFAHVFNIWDAWEHKHVNILSIFEPYMKVASPTVTQCKH